MAEADLYKTLQVDPEADPDVIQAAYRRLAQRFHPDVTHGDPALTERMRAINRAWEVLGDPIRRSAYDLERARRVEGAHGAGAGHHAAGGRPIPVDPNHAGPPPGHPSGSVLTFGRYAGWSLGEIARTDVGYIEWLDRMPIGRPYRDELDAILRRAGRRGPAGESPTGRGLFRRR